MTAPFPRPLRVIAHRGFSARHAENTLDAFEAAIAARADAIELDVHLTTDRVTVVTHDVPNVASEALDPSVPTLAEVFEAVGSRCVIDVEIKADTFEEDAPADAIECQVVDLVRRHGLETTVCVSSFDPRVLARIPPLLPRALVVEETADPGSVIETARQVGAFAVVPEEGRLREPALRALVRADLEVYPYTVDDPERARQLLDLGSHGVVTNDPEAIRRALSP